MPKFRKKPIIIEAEQWFPSKVVEGVVLLSSMDIIPKLKEQDLPYLRESLDTLGFITTLEGGHLVTPGGWVITGVGGEKYPCKPGIFEKTYEAVE